MSALLLAVIYLAFISLGLPDSLLGAAWPVMQKSFDVPSSYAGFVSMAICFMTIVSALCGPRLLRRYEAKEIVIVSIGLTVLGLFGFSFAPSYGFLFVCAVPFGLGAGAIDAALNHYVASHYSSREMNFLHCFYGLGAVISPNIMSLALRYAHWNQGYRWTAFLQLFILAVCVLSLPLWRMNRTPADEAREEMLGIREALRVPGLVLTLIAFFSYCAGEQTCFLWTSSYFVGVYPALGEEIAAAFGSLIFGGLMLGRLISGFVSVRIADRRLIRIGVGVELCGILLVLLHTPGYVPAAIGFLLIGMGMGPVYPSIQHMAPANFGQNCSAAAIGLQMASAYIGSTFMPMVFGLLQQRLGMRIMPLYLIVFAAANIGFLELTYRVIRKRQTT